MKAMIPISVVMVLLLIISACKKDPVPPDVRTLQVQRVSFFTVNCGGVVNNDGGAEITHRGLCWSTFPSPTISDDITITGQGRGSFATPISGLQPGTTYYIRAYAINQAGVGYGETLTFTTLEGALPEVFTHGIAELTSVFADVKAEVLSDGNLTMKERGICWSSNPEPSVEDNKVASGKLKGIFTAKITGLQANTVYYARAYAVNDAGIAYGNTIEITTPEPESLPGVILQNVGKVHQMGATVSAMVVDDGGGRILERGICWSTSPQPVKSDNYQVAVNAPDVFEINMHYVLKPGTRYYLRSYAINIAGIGYSDQVSFVTPAFGAPCQGQPTVTDIDGNVYETVQIATQCWMKQNLKTTRFRNGTPITYGTQNTTYPPYLWYDNNTQLGNSYGALYNVHAVISPAGLCPEGWRLPLYDDYFTLRSSFIHIAVLYSSTLGSVIRSTRETPDEHPRWVANAGNDLSGFSALPGGIREQSFKWLGQMAAWWDGEPGSPRMLSIWYYHNELQYFLPYSGISHLNVRCFKDIE